MPTAKRSNTGPSPSKRKSANKGGDPASYKHLRSETWGRQGTYHQIQIGKRKVWVTDRGLSELASYDLSGKNNRKLYDVARQFDARQTTKKKDTFRDNFKNSLEDSDLTDEQVAEWEELLDSMDDNEIAKWSRDNKRFLEKVMNYKSKDLELVGGARRRTNRRERTEAFEKMLDSMRNAKRVQTRIV